jgi:predicted nuclease with TOPRIM domain
MADGDRGVTLALLSEKLDTLLQKVTDLCDDLEKQEERLRKVENEQARMQERIGLVAGALGILQLIGSAIAAAIGSMR